MSDEADEEREDVRDSIEITVNNSPGEISVKDLYDEIDYSKNHLRECTKDLVDEGRINGSKSKPVIGYIFETEGDQDNDLHVLTSRDSLLWAVDKYAPERSAEARAKSTLQELRTFVRTEVVDGTTVIERAWRFSSKAA